MQDKTAMDRTMHLVTESNGLSGVAKSKTKDCLCSNNDRKLLNNKSNSQWIIPPPIEIPEGYTYPTPEQLECLPEGSKIAFFNGCGAFNHWENTPLVGKTTNENWLYIVPITPQKTEQERKIEELEETINEAKRQIEELKKG